MYVFRPAIDLKLAQWRRKRYGRYDGRHTNPKYGMAPPLKLLSEGITRTWQCNEHLYSL